jgi:hypothetical protein
MSGMVVHTPNSSTQDAVVGSDCKCVSFRLSSIQGQPSLGYIVTM